MLLITDVGLQPNINEAQVRMNIKMAFLFIVKNLSNYCDNNIYSSINILTGPSNPEEINDEFLLK